MSHLELSHNLADAFNALADEAQGLNDRRIVLEHKLRFAHEQVSNFFTWSALLPTLPHNTLWRLSLSAWHCRRHRFGLGTTQTPAPPPSGRPAVERERSPIGGVSARFHDEYQFSSRSRAAASAKSETFSSTL